MMGPSGGLDDLAVFVRVAEQASFARAARLTGMPTSSVSRAVARLEEQLGARLLQRSSRSVVLTEAGRVLQREAGSRIEELRRALENASEREGPPRGVVRLTAPAYTGATRVATLLADFVVAHPEIIVELEAANPLRDLVQDPFDLSIRVGPVRQADFIVRRLWRARFGLFAAPSFVERELGSRRTVSRAELERLPAVVLRASSVFRLRDRRGRRIDVAPTVRFAVNDPRAAVEVARRGVGLVVAPVEAAAVHGAALVTLRPDFAEVEPLDLHLVYPTRTLLPRRVRLVVDWLLASRDEAPS